MYKTDMIYVLYNIDYERIVASHATSHFQGVCILQAENGQVKP